MVVSCVIRPPNPNVGIANVRVMVFAFGLTIRGMGMGRAGYSAHPCLGQTGSTSGGSIHSRIIRSQALQPERPRVIGRSLRLLLGLLIPSATGETTRIIALEATTVAMLLTLHLSRRIFERWADLVNLQLHDGSVGAVLRLIGTLLQTPWAMTRMPLLRLCAQ